MLFMHSSCNTVIFIRIEWCVKIQGKGTFIYSTHCYLELQMSKEVK